MRNEPQKTAICIIRETVEEWRKSQGWSRETVCQQIVDAHEFIGADAATGIHFDPPTRDTFERQKVNAERVFRWLDDVSKDRNLLPMNFLPSIISALPHGLRLKCLGAIFRPVGVDVSSTEADAGDSFNVLPHLAGLIKESAEASTSLLTMSADASLDKLQSAAKEVQDVEETAMTARRAINAEINRRTNNPRCAGCGEDQGEPHQAGCKFDGFAK